MELRNEIGVERWKTLSRQDSEFNAYLDGTFSETHRAIPVRSMNVDTSKEEVTFEIIPVSEIQRPDLIPLVLRATRPESWVLSMGPILVSWLYAWSRGLAMDSRLAISAILGVMLFHAGINLLDDYFDHRKGRDRLNPRGGSRLIQNGWVRARTILHAGLGLVGLAILCGLPIVLESPSLIFVLALIALAAGLGFSSERVKLKYRGLGELITFLLAGPLLTSAFTWAASGHFDWDFVLLGCVFGMTAAIYYHLKNIENIMVDSQANARTLAARVGFDGAKRLVWVFAAFSGLSILFFDWAADADGLFILAFFAHAAVLIPVGRRLALAPSPLSSDLREIRRRGLVVHWATAGVLAVVILVGRLFGLGI